MLKKLWAALAAFFKPPELEKVFSARITNVQDGDSIEFAVGFHTYRGRLVGIDAPEYTQAFGQLAAVHLSKLAYMSKDVRIERVGFDKFNRVLVRVTVGSVDIAQAMLQAGLAWHIVSYTKQSIPEHAQSYAMAAYHARADRLGLWSDPNPMAPAQYRAMMRGEIRPSTRPRPKSPRQRDLFNWH